MLYSLLYRFGKPFYSTRILSHVNSTCSLSALYLHNPNLIQLNKSPGAQWAYVHYYNVLTQVRKVHTGAECRNQAHGERDKSVSTTQPSSDISAAQKGIWVQTGNTSAIILNTFNQKRVCLFQWSKLGEISHIWSWCLSDLELQVILISSENHPHRLSLRFASTAMV